MNRAHARYRLLSQISTRITDGTHQTPAYQAVGVPFVSAKNIKDGRLDFTGCRRISAGEHASLTRSSKPEAGDLLLTKSGSLGDVAIVPDLEFEFSIFESLALLKPRTDLVDPLYLHQYLRSPQVAKYFHSITTGLAVKHLHLGDLRKLEIFLPPLPVQREIAERLATWDLAMRKTAQLIAAKEAARRDWMQDIFRHDSLPRRRLREFVRRIARRNSSGAGQPLSMSGMDGLVSQSQYFGKRIAAQQADDYTLIRRGEFAYNRSSSAGYPFGADQASGY